MKKETDISRRQALKRFGKIAAVAVATAAIPQQMLAYSSFTKATPGKAKPGNPGAARYSSAQGNPGAGRYSSTPGYSSTRYNSVYSSYSSTRSANGIDDNPGGGRYSSSRYSSSSPRHRSYGSRTSGYTSYRV